MNIYVGNIAYTVTADDLRTVFEEFGQVTSANVIMDPYSNRSKGFGFVEMPNSVEAQAAINGLNGRDMGGRTLSVNEAKPRPAKSRNWDSGGRGRRR